MKKDSVTNPESRQAGSAQWADRIEETRAAMDDTIDTINDRIRPHHLAADLIDWSAARLQKVRSEDVRKVARKAYQPVSAAVARHPVGTACFCVAASWLGAQTLRHVEESNGAESVSGPAGSSTVPEPSFQESSPRSAADRCKSFVDDHPLGVGLGLAAAGFISALLLPRTRKEDELMGGMSDEVVGDLRERSVDWIEDGGKAVQSAVDHTSRELRRQDLDPESLGESAAAAASRTAQTMRAHASENVEAAKQRPPEDSIKEGLEKKKDDYVEEASETPADAAEAAGQASRKEGVDPATLRKKLEKVAAGAKEGFNDTDR